MNVKNDSTEITRKNHLKSKLLTLGAILLCQAGVYAQHVSNCPASPEPLTVKQADGKSITIIAKGNHIVNYAETTDGFTVIKNNKGIYEYAKNLNGNLVPSGVPAHDLKARTANETAFLAKSPAHLRYSDAKIQELKNAAFTALNKSSLPGNDGNDHNNGDGGQTFPAKGKRKVLALLIEYPDLKSNYTKEQFQDMMNQPGYKGTGSFRDFYLENSFGQLDLSVDVHGWYMAENNYETYGNKYGSGASRPLIAKAIDDAEKEGVDFSQYDNDKDGYLDGIIIVHAGPGAEVGSQTQYIWSHRSNLGSYTRRYDGTTIGDYMINPETRGSISSPRMIDIGVFCHEFGHILGLPDLYDNNDGNGTSRGLGNWCLMASGNYLNSEKTPACLSAFCKYQLNWVTAVNITAEGLYTLKPAASDSIIYRINTPVSKEYFLLENRQYLGFDSKLPGKGMAIWHIDDSVYAKTWLRGWNSVNANEDHKGIDLEEADGYDHLDKNFNSGDPGDLFPGSRNKADFNDETYPSSKTYNDKKTNVRIYKIVQNADSSITFGFGSAPSASFAPSATTVCQNTQFSITNNSTFATNFQWNFGDGNSDTIQNPTHKFTTPGTYYIKLKVSNNLGQQDEDSIKIIVAPTPDAAFEITGNQMVVSFTNTTKNGKTYTWYWGDGRLSINNLETFTRTYDKPGTYVIKMIAMNENGCKSDTVTKTIQLPYEASAVGEGEPVNYSLKAYPNPTNGILNLSFTIQKPEQVEVGIYNLMGQKIAQIRNGYFGEGEHILSEDIRSYNLSTGVYLVGISVNGNMQYLKMVKN